jgi:lipoprotein
MRKIFLFVLILCAGVVSCNKDQDGAPQNLLIGQWEAVRQDTFRGESWIFGSTYEPNELVYEFTDAGKLIEYQYDLLITTLPYSYDASTQKLSTGASATLSKVETLTATELVIITESSSAGALTSKFVYKRK